MFLKIPRAREDPGKVSFHGLLIMPVYVTSQFVAENKKQCDLWLPTPGHR